MLQKNRLPPEAFGTEKDQGEIARAVYPEPGVLEERYTDLPAFFDLRAANITATHQPQIVSDIDILTQFIIQTIKQRRGVELYELITVDESKITWKHRQISEDVYTKPFEEIATSLAAIMFKVDNCVGIRIEVNKGVHVGIYEGNTKDLEYTGQVKLRYRPINQHRPTKN